MSTNYKRIFLIPKSFRKEKIKLGNLVFGGVAEVMRKQFLRRRRFQVG